MLMQFGKARGWCYALGAEIEELKKQGWAESSEEERLAIIEEKRKSLTLETAPKVVETAIIEQQQEAVKGKPGRKPKNHLLGGVNGNNSKQSK